MCSQIPGKQLGSYEVRLLEGKQCKGERTMGPYRLVMCKERELLHVAP